MINIVLYEPEIPPNTGNIIRLAANCGAGLHLIRPLGFDLDDKRLRRAGLDYHEFSHLQLHEDWQTFLTSTGDSRVFGISTKGGKGYHEVSYQADDYLVFGPETRGLPDSVRKQLGDRQVLRIPMLPDSRSLNLSNAAALIVYEAWRQLGFSGGA